MVITMVAIRAAVGRDKAYKLTDSDGLHLLVLPSGGRYWRMHYRYLGKQKSLAFGVWPDVSLAAAGNKRNVARRLLSAGTDPSQQAKLDKIAASVAAANTVAGAAAGLVKKLPVTQDRAVLPSAWPRFDWQRRGKS